MARSPARLDVGLNDRARTAGARVPRKDERMSNMSDDVVEDIVGGPFADGQEPLVDSFTFDSDCLALPECRFKYACDTCVAGVTLCGVTKRGTVTCRRCNRVMSCGGSDDE